ncbi:MAG TPA: bifunctional phosphoribosyl-AMP cyclohydrolase/phosphoribosyl-ATP diphosphatase HisIE [Woeseiaceae bacterium]|nr:bifunctional phosphoribosyl-AMP cyclohydrolase/phosphoribosyl-ATP diphosphatase HisIE [Woeseiaceae bacterium]
MNEAAIEALDWEKGGGLLPAVIQDADTGTVLMVGYQDRAALRATLERRRVVFFSRSRQELWEKGETSGNHLHLVAVTADCDSDALLIRARPAGPTCHTNNKACFADSEPPLAMLAELERTVTERAAERGPSGSYTAKMLAAGVERIAKKVGEEGVETALAGVVGDDDALAGEAADLLYHLVLLLQSRGMRLADVAGTLAARRR